jgi:hypothetical protein
MNSNTTIQWADLPLQSISGTTETALLVPATGYGTLPSPTLAASAGLTLGLPQDIANNNTYDCHAFVVRLVGKILTAGSYTFKPSLYQVPQSIINAGTQATLSNDSAVFVGAATSSGGAGTQSFLIEAKFIWDSTTKKLTGGVETYLINGVNIAVGTPSGTAGQFQVTTVVSSVALTDLNFLPSFTFGTAGVNGVTVTEFSIDRS